MISFHPTDQQLQDHCIGAVVPAQSLLLSAHLDMCQTCRSKYQSMLEEVSQVELQGHSSGDFDVMLENIMSLPVDDAISVATQPAQIELDGRLFPIPATLARYVKNMGNWSHLLGKIWQAPIELGSDEKAHFIFMEKEGSVPEHTHRGQELTLVLQGEFSDGIHHYDSGDFILMDASNKHSPVATSDDGCLVFSIVDKPLHFTSGFARLLNPFSHLFFK